MEYLDTYDEKGNALGQELRSLVHEKGLWHYTVHCWLYDKEGSLYFQIRQEEGTLYTTASGHVLAGETLEEAVFREVKEELGLEINSEKMHFLAKIPFQMDKVKKDGSLFKDRAISHIYLYEYDGFSPFSCDSEEVKGIMKVDMKEALALFASRKSVIVGKKLVLGQEKEVDLTLADFLINEGETASQKYGFILEKALQQLS